MKSLKKLSINPKKISKKSLQKFLKKYKSITAYFDEETSSIVYYKKIKSLKEAEKILKISNIISDRIYHHPQKITIIKNIIHIKINTNDYNNISVQDLRYIYLLNTVLEKI